MSANIRAEEARDELLRRGGAPAREPRWTVPTWHPAVILTREHDRIRVSAAPVGCFVELRPDGRAGLDALGTAGIVAVDNPRNPGTLATMQGYGSDPRRAARDLLAGRARPAAPVSGRLDAVLIRVAGPETLTLTDAPDWLHVELREPGRPARLIQ